MSRYGTRTSTRTVYSTAYSVQYSNPAYSVQYNVQCTVQHTVYSNQVQRTVYSTRTCRLPPTSTTYYSTSLYDHLSDQLVPTTYCTDNETNILEKRN